MSPTDFGAILSVLSASGVEFILVGGLAAIVHGAARATLDVDVVYRRTPENFNRLAISLKDHNPYLRGAPAGLPFLWDEETLKSGLNFTLTTKLGDIDLLGYIIGGGSYEDLLPAAKEGSLFGVKCKVLGLSKLIEVKRAAGRPKDFEAIAELEVLLEESRPPFY